MAKTVFLIDDDAMNNLIGKKLLQKSGFAQEVETFSDMTQALSRLQAGPCPDIIFLDINMPPTDGWSFLDQLQTLQLAELPAVYMLSSGISQEDRERAMQYPMVKGAIDKPLSVAKLEALGQ